MRITIAIDSLKGSLSSLEAGAAAAEGIKRVYADADISVRPLADGGEGTMEALVHGMKGQIHTIDARGPLGEPRNCRYGVIEKSRTAVIEMAEAAGITLVAECQKNPLYTTTYGVGELIKAAIAEGCRRFVIGIGGSATNDGGIGMLQALGFGFLDEQGKQVPYGAAGLAQIREITEENVLPELADCTFRIACDVTNPLCGEFGCSAVFGPQKGADADMVKQMDHHMSRFAKLVREKYPKADALRPGTGAAGGLGFAFLTFMNTVLESGVKIVLEETELEEYVKNSDFVITGEGRLDGQTVMGKAPIGVAETAKRYGKRVIAFSGCVAEDAVLCNENGIDAFFPILRSVTSLEEAMESSTAAKNMSAAAEQVFRLIKSVKA